MTTKKTRQSDRGGPGGTAVDPLYGPMMFHELDAMGIIDDMMHLVQQISPNPRLLMEQQAEFVRQAARIFANQSDIAPKRGDKRFADPAWSDNVFYRSYMQGYLAWADAMTGMIDAMGLDKVNADRMRFMMSMLTDAFSPTNSLLGNPAAMRKFFDTGGQSIMDGLKNLVDDMLNNNGMPAQVDKSKFKVGENLALTPGVVVFKNEMLELIQYAPQTEKVYSRPTLFVPPQINKYYVFDLAPDRSFIEHAVKNGIQMFLVSWRNPTADHSDWSFEEYCKGLLEAVDVVRTISGSDDVNLTGICVGGLTTAAMLSYLSSKGDARANSLTLVVSALDWEAEHTNLTMFITPQMVNMVKKMNAGKGLFDGKEMGRVFAWLRPNDLVWNYWVNNYLLGNPPPAFDILYWNNDNTRLPAKFHGEVLESALSNPFVNPGRMTILGAPLDLGVVKCDVYSVSGTTDHIAPWKGCYHGAKCFGGNVEFVLCGSGHIQSIVNPPGNSRIKYYTNDKLLETAEEWLESAKESSGTWWDHWVQWLQSRSGEQRAASSLGHTEYKPLYDAPGKYVFEP